MEDEEHEVYGQEIPVDGEDVDMGAGGDDAAKVRDAPVAAAATRPAPLSRSRTQNPNAGTDPIRVQLHELDDMKRRLKEMEEETDALCRCRLRSRRRYKVSVISVCGTSL